MQALWGEPKRAAVVCFELIEKPVYKHNDNYSVVVEVAVLSDLPHYHCAYACSY